MKVINWLKENKLLLIIIAVGAFLRIYKIDYQSVWLDEIFSLNQSNPKMSLIEIYKYLRTYDPHPPLYYFSLHFFFQIFGYTTLVMRLYSALFGVAGIIAIYFLGKELMNKKVGLIAALLLAVNYFQIYYSQEARMYSMLFFTTTMSFYFLIKFIKKPNLKSTLLYIGFSTLMIYTHFFALFSLISQYIILLLFIVKPYKIESKKFLGFTIASGLTTIVLYIPALFILFENTKRTSIWIPMPTVDVYTQIFKEFFGQSEIVLFMIVTVLILFFVKLYNRENSENYSINPFVEKQVFSFLILFTWIFVSIIIPLIGSYINLPMIVSRYFINILPAFIILIAFGVYYIKNNVVRLSILSLLIVFSITDIVIVKKYYDITNKTQFRAAAQFIIDNKNGDEVVSSLAMYLPFFLNNDTEKNTIIDKSLDEYVSEISKNSSNIKSFWYFDGHIRPFNPSEESKLFLENNYVVDKNIDLYDCYVKHFILKSNYKPKIDISSFNPLKDRNGDAINFSVEVFENSQENITISGWAYFEKQVANNCKIQLLAIKDNEVAIIFNESVRREDVTSYFKSPYDISNSGFKAVFPKLKYGKGTYKIAIYILDSQNQKKGLVITDKFFKVE